ncbi:MAG: hypothetical protein K9G46_03655 [Flavobacteriales bacterium]|nr:hypothetical protein [Flavobacteriales bacterium]
MNFIEHSFRHASSIFRNEEFGGVYEEIISTISGISDDDLISEHESYGVDDQTKIPKSVSRAINNLLKARLEAHGWQSESAIFQNPDYTGDRWRLDFAKVPFSVEVAFNHTTVIAWNLIKPVLAGELNHVQKAVQTKGGIIICATQGLKDAGGFDSAVGTYEKFIEHLDPMRNLLTVPIMIIGLEAPVSFVIEQHQLELRKKIGRVVRI